MTIRSAEPEADKIISGLHKIREDLLAEHGNHLLAYVNSAKERLKESGKQVVTRPRAASARQRKSGN